MRLFWGLGGVYVARVELELELELELLRSGRHWPMGGGQMKHGVTCSTIPGPPALTFSFSPSHLEAIPLLHLAQPMTPPV